jgi:hypothetical protein
MAAGETEGDGAQARRMRRAGVALALFVSACAGVDRATPGLAGKPLDEFFDELKAELRDVHWRIRGTGAGCGDGAPREVDLRNATITLDLQRVAEVSVDGAVRLVAVPLGGGLLSPLASASASRKSTQDLVVKLDVAGPSRLYDAGAASEAAGPVARTVNAAIDGFMRSSTQEPCIRLTSLKLAFVVDVQAAAGGGFKLTVPAGDLGAEASRRDVNTLTLTWDKVVSNALR